MKSSTSGVPKKSDGDVLGYWGQSIIEDHLDVLAKEIATQLSAQEGNETAVSQPSKLLGGGKLKDCIPLPTEGHDKVQGKVGILGAGVGGLYTALILDSLDIKYEILEASNRTGGRLFTHKFPNGNDYDYYDVGAMRYPLPKKGDDGKYKSGVMKRLGELIDYSKLNNNLPDDVPPLRDTLIDYYYKAKTGGTFLYFNNQRYQVPADKPDPPNFNARATGVEPEFIKVGVDNIVGDVVAPFARMIMEDLEHNTGKGWDVMKQNDAYSLRAYMSFKYIPSINFKLPPMHLTTNVINWCETFDKSTGWYDRALTEQVLEALAFARAGSQTFGEVEWKCFDGGSQVLTDYMTKYIASTAQDGEDLINFEKSVRRISMGTRAMKVSVRGESAPRTYSHVISTLPLPCLRTIDISCAGLNVMQTTALRKLQYGPSIKIGVRFKSAWWTTKFGIVGGQSFTDLPLRTIVYPSYGVDSETPSTVLIASYCWTNDAERLGSLINTGKTGYDEQLKDLVLRNLTRVHGPGITYNDLKSEYVEMHAWDWNHNPLTGGAFAFFGPGDFQDLYTSLTVPNFNRRLHFAGEAISTRHAWVVGALDSAWRAVYEYLITSGQEGKVSTFFEKWGKNIEWVQPSSQFADEDGGKVPGDGKKSEVHEGGGLGGQGSDRENTLLRVHMGYAYAAESSGNLKY